MVLNESFVRKHSRIGLLEIAVELWMRMDFGLFSAFCRKHTVSAALGAPPPDTAFVQNAETSGTEDSGSSSSSWVVSMAFVAAG